MYKRLIVAGLSGAILGVICIFGAQLRFGWVLSPGYLFSFWFNRLLMGIVIGLLAFQSSLPIRLVRGAFLGLVVSFAFYSATEFLDLTGFLIGAVYGVIIEFVAFKIAKK